MEDEHYFIYRTLAKYKIQVLIHPVNLNLPVYDVWLDIVDVEASSLSNRTYYNVRLFQSRRRKTKIASARDFNRLQLIAENAYKDADNG